LTQPQARKAFKCRRFLKAAGAKEIVAAEVVAWSKLSM
jgi:hypothetical protein